MTTLYNNNVKPRPLITVFTNENSLIDDVNYIVKTSDEIILQKDLCTEISTIADTMIRFLVPSLTIIEKYSKTPLFSIWDMGFEKNKRTIGILIDNQCYEPLIRKRLQKMVNEVIYPMVMEKVSSYAY